MDTQAPASAVPFSGSPWKSLYFCSECLPGRNRTATVEVRPPPQAKLWRSSCPIPDYLGRALWVTPRSRLARRHTGRSEWPRSLLKGAPQQRATARNRRFSTQNPYTGRINTVLLRPRQIFPVADLVGLNERRQVRQVESVRPIANSVDTND
jgi:hypothetical protein